MSCYEWEKGEFKIPSAAWAGFKEGLRLTYNEMIDKTYEAAVEAHQKAMSRIKGKRGVNVRRAVIDVIDEMIQADRAPYWGYRDGGMLMRRWDAVNLGDVMGVIFPDADSDTKRPPKPMKKNLPPKATNRTVRFDGEDFTILLDNAKRTVKWIVEENNHAVDRARESVMGRALFRGLKEVEWGRGSGGYIFGGDEYQRDAETMGPGMGGSFLKECFGPLGEQVFEGQMGIRRRKRR